MLSYYDDPSWEPPQTPALRRKVRPSAIFVFGIILGTVLGILGTNIYNFFNNLPATTDTQSETEGAVGVAEATSEPQSAAVTLLDIVAEQTRHFKGDPDAPITIIEFSDFKCGFCGRFAAETSPQLQEEYIESGLVRFGYQSIAILSEESLYAAEAGECAADQEAFWPYHDLLFAQLNYGDGDFSRESLKQLAADLGLDTAAFNECMDSEKYADLIRNQTMDARSIGIQSTPTFIINGRPFIGAQPFEAFQQVIEDERAAGGE